MPKLKIRDALDEAEQDGGWKCETCEAPRDEGERWCLHCKLYWEQEPLDDDFAKVWDDNADELYRW